MDASSHALWAFNAFCNDDSDASCEQITKCPGFDGGGVAAQPCTDVFSQCLLHSAQDSGLFDRVFTCESTATSTWELNRICKYEKCDDIDAATCPSFDGGGIAGQTCTTALSRCITNASTRVFICQPTGGDFYTFNGYCDSGAGTPACNSEFDACAPNDAGVAGSACAVPHDRCVNAGNQKVFVCADRE